MTAVVPLAPAVAPGTGATTLWNRVKLGAHRRAGRIEWIVVVLVMISPQLITVLLVRG